MSKLKHSSVTIVNDRRLSNNILNQNESILRLKEMEQRQNSSIGHSSVSRSQE